MIIKNDISAIQSYFEDASGLRGGHAERVVVPENEGELAEYLREASRRGVPVTISGGGTGVTGGRVPFGGDVLSLERFGAISAVQPLSPARAKVTVQAGVPVADLKKAVLEKGWMYAPDPTEQSSFIGGNVATNASGSRGFKYGSTRSYVRRVRIALPTGEIFDIERGAHRAGNDGIVVFPGGARRLRIPGYRLPDIKNAAGYYALPGMDLIDLFIGQEGTLGVVTEVDVELLPAIRETLGGIAFFPSEESSWEFAAEARDLSLRGRAGAPGTVEAMSLEYFDRFALGLLREDYPRVPSFAKAAIFFEQVLDGREEGAVTDGWADLLNRHGAPLESVWFSNSTKEQKAFREFRHRLPEKVNEVVRRNGFPKTGTDIAVPVRHFPEMLRFYRETMDSSRMEHLLFGHIGECHMHANFLPATEEQFQGSKRLYAALVGKALSLGGTVSAEHGIGKLKHRFLEQMVGRPGLLEMARIKKTLDPSMIFGRGNLFPADLLDGGGTGNGAT